MANRRIEFPDDNSNYAHALRALGAYRDAEQAGDLPAAAASADRAAQLAELLADHALLNATTSERALATAMGLPRPTLQYRIKRARARTDNRTDDENEN